MKLRDIMDNISSIYFEIENNNRKISEETGLQCVDGCGACCNNTDIEESVLTMLYSADILYKEGKAEFYLDLLNDNEETMCIFYEYNQHNKNIGRCREYKARGLVCRLFGFAGKKGKHGEVVFAPCERVRENNKEAEKIINSYMENGGEIPIMQHYGYKILALDPNMGTKRYPINTALKIALEKILFIYSYN